MRERLCEKAAAAGSQMKPLTTWVRVRVRVKRRMNNRRRLLADEFVEDMDESECKSESERGRLRGCGRRRFCR